ncbi:MAG TPA: Shedu anti-phage system protein SduA domain-containing protein [Candidatus Dormibacteraeota bacterium]|jgi:RNA polymerase sigma factor (sigma-70 family)|nr:Shedu anti-phage system protein SduA domain-containing protein [Candidatus Dormibacteraeota bacterium]
MLDRRTNEAQWQSFFSENPYVLSMSLPVRLAPQDIVPMGRPGLSEPDFVFFAKGCGPLPTYGVIEIKRPDSKIITVTRSNAAILSRDAETAIQQATDYSRNCQDWHVQAKQDSILILGNRADLFVIMGMSAEFSRKLGLELYREMIERRLPRNLKIIPYDTLLGGFEAKVPLRLHLLVPAGTSGLRPSAEGTVLVDSELREMLSRSIQSLSPGYRTVFVLHDIEGLTHDEVAAALGLSVRNIRTRLQRARVKLEGLITASSPEVAARWIEYKERSARK